MTTFQPGDTLGRYRVERALGHGAMGEVYLARDPQIDRPLAVKTLRLVGVRDEEVAERKERLLREARTAGRLIHPHIVTLFDAGEQDGVLFLAFEYVPGEDLSHRLRRGPLAVGEALRLAREACEGLGHAHRSGIVHRDVKPSNLMLDAEGSLKISDFGIAKMAGQGTELTISGAVMGSPHYLSPEQVRGEELDGRSDLFSLGIVLYEMLTGRRPFEGETISTLVFQILGTEPPPLPALRPGLAPRLPALLGRMLAKDRARRVSDARSAAEEIAALERELPEELLAGTATMTAAPTDATVVMDSGSLAAQAAGGEAAGEPARQEAVWPLEADGPVAADEANRSTSGGGAGATGGAGSAAVAGATGGPGTAGAPGAAAAGAGGSGAGSAASPGSAADPATGRPAGTAPAASFVPPPPPGAAGAGSGSSAAEPAWGAASGPPPVPAATGAGTGAAAADPAWNASPGPGTVPGGAGVAGGPPPLPTGAAGTPPPPPPGLASGTAAPGPGSGGTYAVPALGGGRRRGPLLAVVGAAVLAVAVLAGGLLLLRGRGEAPAGEETLAEMTEDGLLLPGEETTAAQAGPDAALRPDRQDPRSASPSTGAPGGRTAAGAAGQDPRGAGGDRPQVRPSSGDAGQRPGGAAPATPSTGSGGTDAPPVRTPSQGTSSPPLPTPSEPVRDTAADARDDAPPAAADPSRSAPPPASRSRDRAAPAPHAEISTGMSLVFEVVPPDAFVLVDGTVIGRAAEYGANRRRAGTYSLPEPGEHRVTLRRDGMEDYHIRLDASASVGETTVRARMKPLAAAEVPFHELEMHRVKEAIALRVDPPNARVLVDDKPVGLARDFAGGRLGRGGWLELPLGMHRVSFLAVGRKRVDIAVDVTSGATEARKRVDVVLPPLPGGGGGR